MFAWLDFLIKRTDIHTRDPLQSDRLGQRIPDATIVRDSCFSAAGHSFSVTVFDVPPDASLPLE